MPTVEDHKEIALAKLRRLAQPDSQPTLSDPELDEILDDVQRASFWLSDTEFVIGDVVLPVTKNGHRYLCIQGGETAATEPGWPTIAGATVTDGEVIWQEAGADYENVFDVRAAAYEAWQMKAGKVANLFDVTSSSNAFKQSQIYDRCIEMAERFAPIIVEDGAYVVGQRDF
jgi:hypothetical protein